LPELHVLRNKMLRFIVLLLPIFLSGCIFGPPDGPRLSDSVISSVRENEIEVTVTEAVDQMGWYRVTDVYIQVYNLAEIEIYDNYKVGDRVYFSFQTEKTRITNVNGASYNSIFHIEPQVTLETFGDENQSE